VNLKQLSLQKVYPYLLITAGILGLIASIILSHDTYAILQNPHYVPSCNLNPIISCGNVINAAGDKIYGLPYPFYGIGLFSMLISLGGAMLAGSTKLKRWFWLIFQFLITLGVLGSYALLLKSMYTIHSLCPFCLSVDVIVTTLFWYTTLYNFDNKAIKLKGNKTKAIYAWVRKHHLDILILWFVIVTAFILHHFWYYYGKHL
jgi:uncharacterized membrane protein